MEFILAIESSCDETSAAVVSTNGAVLSTVTASQITTHQAYGGVIPEIASRMHVEAINPTVEESLVRAGLSIEQISAIAVTQGPGLLGALMIGVQAAKTLAYIYGKPLIAVNHMEGHILANFIYDDPALAPQHDLKIEYPYVCLVVSGGHTNIVIAKQDGVYQTVGRTVDDAAGECYDKVARLLQLGYPGGPRIDELAKAGDAEKIKFTKSRFTTNDPNNEFGFSFSGLKTAVINYYRKNPQEKVEDVCASFQQTVVAMLVEKTLAAAEKYNITKLFIAGGVAANSQLRNTLVQEAALLGITVAVPPLNLCTDNAAMIGGAAILKFLRKDFSTLDLKANPGLRL